MKKFFVWAAFAATLAAVHSAATDARARPNAGPGVAIIDISYLFKHHARFKLLKEELQRDVEAAEAEFQAKRESLKNLVERLKGYRKGSPEYKALDEELAKRQADLALEINIQKKHFLEQEARNYYTIYREILDEVKYHADTNGISLVLSFNGDPAESSDPPEVMRELNKSVVYHNPAIDITPIILERLNGGLPKRAPGGPGAQNSQTKRPSQQGVPRPR